MGRCAERQRQRTVNPSHQKHRRFDSYSWSQFCSVRLSARTLAFHAGKMGSIPIRCTKHGSLV